MTGATGERRLWVDSGPRRGSERRFDEKHRNSVVQFNLFRDGERVVDLDAEILYVALQLFVAEQELARKLPVFL
uniref:Uncharacterized protein n=1 Tax=Sinorhizobium fredii (strain NBRC 101917 / NGR234) TaxID=394 RepID=Q6W1D8_SINFN|nr:Hypothetical protein RNGR00304 [Sinorhizobium fredii NGR234]